MIKTPVPATLAVLLAFTATPGPAVGQEASAEAEADSAAIEAPDARPEAAPDDVESIDAIMTAVYDVISGPKGEARDWDRMRSLFLDGARLIPTGQRRSGEAVHLIWSVDEYINTAGGQLEQGGFFEQEVGRKVDLFGNIAQVFSTYESRRTLEDPDPFMRGINSFQLWNDGSRWWVVTIFWQNETPNTPIPEEYLD